MPVMFEEEEEESAKPVGTRAMVWRASARPDMPGIASCARDAREHGGAHGISNQK